MLRLYKVFVKPKAYLASLESIRKHLSCHFAESRCQAEAVDVGEVEERVVASDLCTSLMAMLILSLLTETPIGTHITERGV